MSRGGCRPPPPRTHHALLTCFEAGSAGKCPGAGSAVRAPRRAPRSRGAARAHPGPRAPRPAPPPAPVGDPPRSRLRPGARALRRYLLPGAASPTLHPGLRGRLGSRLSHEAPRLALPPPRPPALHPHPRRWSRGGCQRGSAFAALAAQGEAALLSPAPSASFSQVLSSPLERRLQRAAATV